jgi:hypothetical protein
MTQINRHVSRLNSLRNRLDHTSQNYVDRLEEFARFPLTQHRLGVLQAHKAFYTNLSQRLTPQTHPHFFKTTESYELHATRASKRARTAIQQPSADLSAQPTSNASVVSAPPIVLEQTSALPSSAPAGLVSRSSAPHVSAPVQTSPMSAPAPAPAAAVVPSPVIIPSDTDRIVRGDFFN